MELEKDEQALEGMVFTIVYVAVLVKTTTPESPPATARRRRNSKGINVTLMRGD